MADRDLVMVGWSWLESTAPVAAAAEASVSTAIDNSVAAVAGSLMSVECCEEAFGDSVEFVVAASAAAQAEAEAGTEVGGSAGIDVVVVADVKFLTGSGVELTSVKWLMFWVPVDGPLVVGEWLRDRVRLEPCRLGDVLRALAVPVPVPPADPVLELLWWLSRDNK